MRREGRSETPADAAGQALNLSSVRGLPPPATVRVRASVLIARTLTIRTQMQVLRSWGDTIERQTGYH